MKELEALRDQVRVFARERDWDQFHSPKNLAMALAAEAGELLEIFQWLTEEQSRALDAKSRAAADEEIADVLIYLVRVEGTLDESGIALLRHGLELDGVKLKPAKVSWANEGQLRFVLREGRKRQIRRMCEMVGLAVTGLKRVRSGGVPLGPLPVGQWRYLRRDERF